MAKKYGLPRLPDNIVLLRTYHEMVENKSLKRNLIIERMLKTRPVRSLSGIVNISVLTKPYPCPGHCLYCPTEPNIPKSYVSGEPAVERAKRLKYDPHLQVQKRIEMLEAEGHPTDKIELRVVGGTWSYYPRSYREWFTKRCFDAANGKTSLSLAAAQRLNEKAKNKIIGLSIETRPDFVDQKEVEHLRKLGATMVELGVQSIYDDVLEKNKRGHLVGKTIRATKLLRDAGFKILYQMMPNLLGSSLKRDEKMFKELFSNPDFQPDLLKIYPCALLKKTPLYKYWRNKKYRPYGQTQLLKLIKEIKKALPYYVRIQRISRDIPSTDIVVGPAKISNLRQMLADDMAKTKWRCKCIRCREVKGEYNSKEKIRLFRQDYMASGGKEIFLSFENNGRTKLYSLLRLRIIPGEKAMIRELHTYGQQLSLIEENMISPQHKGFGKKLVKEAEKIAKKEFGIKKIAVISGVGVRGYFRSLGYKLENTYMAKRLS